MNIIVAIDKENGIGKDNGLLAHISPDLKYFKEKTLNSVIVMGYNTYISLPKRPLPNRINIVLTTKKIQLDRAIVVNSIEALLNKVREFESNGYEVFICGGAKVYESMMPYVDKLYVTEIMHKFEADTFFPKIDLSEWSLISDIAAEENLNHKYPHKFLVYEKKAFK